MRNLKRALSLALASVMLLGMMVVGTSASYADVSSKNNLEAIEVLKLVGVMTGDDKGNFNPDANVTRNEMAVIMCNLLGLKIGGSHPFTDVPAWASPYVAACYNNGIIAGVSATQFNGDANVTAVQASLMVMKALGYFGYAGEFGDNWKLSVVKQASKIDLYDGINAYTDQIMTRNEVAQLVLNALECTVQVVTEQGGVQVDGNGVSVNVKATYTYEDAKNNSGKDYGGGNVKTMELCEKLYGTDLKKDTTDSTTDDFGRPATKWTYNNDTVTSAKSPDLTYTKDVKGKEIRKDLGNVTPETIAVIRNNKSDSIDGLNLKSNDDTKVGAKGTLTEVYYDKTDKKATIVVIDSFLAKATEDYDTKDEDVTVDIYSTLLDRATLSSDDFAVSGVKEKDYLLVNLSWNDSEYVVKAVAEPTVVENATVSASRADDYVVAGGTKYTYNAVAKAASSKAMGQDLMSGKTSYDLNGDGYDLYLDAYGYVVGVEGYDAGVKLDDYLFVKETGTNGFDVIAKVVFADGTSKTVTVDKVGDDDVSAKTNSDKVAEKNFYKFDTDKDGNYELTTIDTRTDKNKDTKVVLQSKQEKATVDSNAKPITYLDGEGKATTLNIAGTSATVFVAKNKVYTGVKNAPKVSGTENAPLTVYYLTNEDGRLMLVYTEKKGTSSTSSKDLVYILSSTAEIGKDGDDKTYTYTVIMNGEKTTLVANQANKAVGLYEIETYTDGRADLGTAKSGTPGKDDLWKVLNQISTADYDDGTLILGDDSFILADNVKIFTISGTTVKTISASGVKNAVTKDGFVKPIVIKESTSNDDIVTVYLSK